MNKEQRTKDNKPQTQRTTTPHMNQAKIVIYRASENADFQLEVRVEDETIWLTQAQIVDLFSSSKANVSEHIKHIYQSCELDPKSTVRKIRTVQNEGIFYDGQIFDAWEFVSGIIKDARLSIILIDHYVDESVLSLLAKRQPKVEATIFTAAIDQRLKNDLKRHNALVCLFPHQPRCQ